MKIFRQIAVAVLALMSVMGSSLAAPYAWQGAVSGTWSDPSRWSPSGPPGIGDTATLAQNGTYTVTFSGSSNADTLTVQFGNVSFTLNSQSLAVGGVVMSNGATVNISGGDFSTTDIFSGFSTANNSLTINTGKAMNFGGNNFRAGITETGDNNSITVQGGTQITNVNLFRLGTEGGDNNQVNIKGAGTSLAVTGEFYIGGSLAGSVADNNIVRVQDGASVTYTGASMKIGGGAANINGTGNSLLVTGTGSQFTLAAASGFITVGGGTASYNNSIEVADGGSFVTNRTLAIGATGTGNSVIVNGGTVTADGGTVVNDTLRIENGGYFKTSTSQFTDFDVEATGKVVFNSGSLLLSSRVNFKGGNKLTVGDGTGAAATLILNNVTSGTAIFSGGIELASDGIMAGSGTTAASVKTLAATSTFSPGIGAVGKLTLGNLDIMAGSRFMFDLGPGLTSDLLTVALIDATGVGTGGLLVDLNMLGGAGAGTYTVMSFTGQSGLMANQFALGQELVGYNVGFDLKANSLDLIVTAIPEPQVSALLFLACACAGIARRVLRKKPEDAAPEFKV